MICPGRRKFVKTGSLVSRLSGRIWAACNGPGGEEIQIVRFLKSHQLGAGRVASVFLLGLGLSELSRAHGPMKDMGRSIITVLSRPTIIQ